MSSASSSASSISIAETADLLLLLLALWKQPSEAGSGQKTDRSTFLEAGGKSLKIGSKVPITKVLTKATKSAYTIDESTRKDFIVRAVAGRGNNGVVYWVDNMDVVLKLDTRVIDNAVRESIETERKNLAQIEELFGVYTEYDNPTITLMRGYTGTGLRETEIFRTIYHPVNYINLNLDNALALLGRAKTLTATNIRYYLMKYHLLHTDIKEKNVLFKLDGTGELQSAQLIDWGEGETVDPTKLFTKEVDELIERHLAEWDKIYDTAKRRHDDAVGVKKAQEEYKKKHHGKNPDDRRSPRPWDKKPDEKKDDPKGKEGAK
ncbi:hypothetical protein DL96DRAFT_1823524 [Flagelloscypha sp. PMI_526]|nr:hypothetical protein DL96DRAFT_1823524 [Flagelloscypha sp. PMI_526]